MTSYLLPCVLPTGRGWRNTWSGAGLDLALTPLGTMTARCCWVVMLGIWLHVMEDPTEKWLHPQGDLKSHDEENRGKTLPAFAFNTSARTQTSPVSQLCQLRMLASVLGLVPPWLCGGCCRPWLSHPPGENSPFSNPSAQQNSHCSLMRFAAQTCFKPIATPKESPCLAWAN